jgi:outer membrane protein OmpA-like peptidoglycan-associated protein
MKTLSIGMLIFLSWSALATYLYVCKIRGLCNEGVSVQNDMVQSQPVSVTDSMAILQKPVTDSPGTMSVYFEFDKSEFTADAMTDSYINKSNSYMSQNQNAVLLIVGHTDAIGTDDYNMGLGGRRAQAIKNYFEAKGISASKSITESRGEKEPVDDNNTAEGRAKNRRTVITIK